MRSQQAWKAIGSHAMVFVVAWTLAIIWSERSGSRFTAPAFAGVTVADESAETVFSSSQDGKTIYMWRYFGSRPPKFIGQSDAILGD